VTGITQGLSDTLTSDPEPPPGHRRKGRMSRLLRRTSRRQRVVLVAGVVVVLAAGAGGGIWATRGSSSPAGPTYQLVAAASSTLRSTVSSTGTIEPADQDNLNFAASGQVTAVDVTVGKKVKAGQVLAKINSASLSASVAQAEATEASDASKLSSDQADSSVTSAQLTADQTAVTAAENQVTDAKQALAEANLTSPISGVVAALNLSVGQEVSGSGSGGSGTSGAGTGSGNGGSTGASSDSSSSSSSSSSSAQVVVISTTSYVVNGTVDDTEVGSVQAGDQAVIVPDGATTPVYGVVSSVGLIASTTSGVATYPVTIAVTGNPGGLYAGASATVTLIVKQLNNVTTVPTAALHYTSSGAEVYEIAGGHEVAHPVTVGMTSAGETQILSGLTVGTEVAEPTVTGGATRTTTGGTGRGTRGGFGGTGGFGGGGFGGGGFGGAGGFGGGGVGGN